MSASVAIVIPTFNERENFSSLCDAILRELPTARIFVIDDNSPDGTAEVVAAYAQDHPTVELFRRNAKTGLGAAYVAGYEFALARCPDAQYFIQMDADFSHDPAFLRPMLECAASADLVVGSRYVQGISIVNWPLSRLIVSKLGTAFARIVTGLPVTDATSGFKCYRRATLEALNLSTIRSNGYVFQVETSFRAWRTGFTLKDLPIVFYERQHGESKLHLDIALEAFRIILFLGVERLFFRKQTRPLLSVAELPEV